MNKMGNIALIVSALGGGTTRHVFEMATSWNNQGYPVIIIELNGKIVRIIVMENGLDNMTAILSVSNHTDTLLKLLRYYNVSVIHYHHFIYADNFMLSLPNKLNVPYVVTLHDYYTICPRIQLVNEQGLYCREQGNIECNKCLGKRKDILFGVSKDVSEIVQWRTYWYDFLKKSILVLVPQDDVKKRIYSYYPKLNIKVFENPETIQFKFIKKKDCGIENKSLNIGVIGAITHIKGADVVFECAKELKRNNVRVKIIVFGELYLSKKRELPSNILVTGKYDDREIYQKIVKYNIDFFWFPGIWPETYSYTLSIPVRLGIPSISANIGAIGNRIISHSWGTVYPLDSKISSICYELLNFDYQSFALHKENYKIEQESFPDARCIYGNIISKDGSIDDRFFGMLNKILSNYKYIDVSGITGAEYRCICTQAVPIKWKVCSIFNFDIRWVYSFFKSKMLNLL